MQQKFIFTLALVALFSTIPLRAQEEKEKINDITVDLQLLTQGEIRDGGILAPDSEEENLVDRAMFIVGRARLNLGYKRKGLELKVSPQYTGIWGQSGYGDFHLFEAYAKYSFSFGLFGQIGRQALSYDDERIIGPNDWAMAAVSHDVLKLGYEGFGHKVHVLLAYNQNPENLNGYAAYIAGAQPYKTMQTLWYHYDVPNFPFGASFLFMNLGVQADVNPQEKQFQRFQQMLGTHLTFTPDWGNFSASYYHQLGKEEHGMPINAFMAAVKATVKPMDILEATLGYDYLSGDPMFVVPGKEHIGLIQHKVMRGFNSLYGSHHKFYGLMEFFYISTFVSGFSPGLQNAYTNLSFKLWKKLKLGAGYHYLATSTKLTDLDMTLGHCVEANASWDITKDINLSAGFSYMTGTKTMEALKRASSDGSIRWAWLTLVVNPRIFKFNW